MNFYETVVILQDSTFSSAEIALGEFESILTGMGAKLVRYEDWGSKPFAYPIRRNKKGHYLLLIVEGPHSALAELERQLKIKENVLRFLTLKLEKIDSKPSILAIKHGTNSSNNKETKSEA